MALRIPVTRPHHCTLRGTQWSRIATAHLLTVGKGNWRETLPLTRGDKRRCSRLPGQHRVLHNPNHIRHFLSCMEESSSRPLIPCLLTLNYGRNRGKSVCRGKRE